MGNLVRYGRVPEDKDGEDKRADTEINITGAKPAY
jgi:hypothetical protein